MYTVHTQYSFFIILALVLTDHVHYAHHHEDGGDAPYHCIADQQLTLYDHHVKISCATKIIMVVVGANWFWVAATIHLFCKR